MGRQGGGGRIKEGGTEQGKRELVGRGEGLTETRGVRSETGRERE